MKRRAVLGFAAVISLCMLDGCASYGSRFKMNDADTQQYLKQLRDEQQQTESWNATHPAEAAAEAKARWDAIGSQQRAREIGEGAQINANMGRPKQPQSNAAYVCGAGPGPGEIQVGETGGGQGVASEPLCVSR